MRFTIKYWPGVLVSGPGPKVVEIRRNLKCHASPENKLIELIGFFLMSPIDCPRFSLVIVTNEIVPASAQAIHTILLALKANRLQ